MSEYNAEAFESIAFGTKPVEGGFVAFGQIAIVGTKECINIVDHIVLTKKLALERAKEIHRKMEANWEKTTGHPWPFDGRIEFLQ